MKSILISLIIFILCINLYAQTVWTKHPDNPIFSDTTGGWTLPGALAPSILIIDSTYHMWYVGNDGTYGRIGYATSLDGISWVPYANNPILDVGLPGSYEESAVTEPSVIYDGSTFHMWYTGMNTTVSPYREAIGYASSSNGTTWTKYSDQPVLDIGPIGDWDDTKVFGPSVIYDDSLFHIWYSGGSTDAIRHIGYATSPDGFTWTKDTLNNPVMRAGLPGNWDYPRASQPEVYFDGTRYHMFYGGGMLREQEIGHATSPDKIIWTKNTNNPVLKKGESGSWDDYHVNNTSVIIDTANSIFRMWYSGRQNPNYYPPFFIGYATAPIITSIEDNKNLLIPFEYNLSQNYPNPFNPATNIEYQLANICQVELSIYNLLGQKVFTLVNKKQQAGTYKVRWDAKSFASGIYYCQLCAGQRFVETKKLILLR